MNFNKMNSESVYKSLEEAFGPPHSILLKEVRNGTGFSKTVRTADAISVSLWPSRGIYIHGFEIKISKADLMNEIKDPAKSDEIARYCRFWSLVVPTKNIVEEVMGLLPSAWGVYVMKDPSAPKKGVKSLRAPEKNINEKTPDILFMASLFRNFSSAYVLKSAVNEMLRDEREKTIKSFNFDPQEAVKLRAEFEEEKFQHKRLIRSLYLNRFLNNVSEDESFESIVHRMYKKTQEAIEEKQAISRAISDCQLTTIRINEIYKSLENLTSVVGSAKKIIAEDARKIYNTLSVHPDLRTGDGDGI